MGILGTEGKALKRIKKANEESGIALVVVLGVVSLFSVLVTMQIATSKVVAIISKVSVDRNKNKYAAESATAYTQWMLMNYNFNNPTQDLPEEEEDQEEIWVADGKEHKLEMVDGITAKVAVFDVARGWDINQLKAQKSNLLSQYSLENDELRDQLDEFFAVFEDYTDQDDLLRHPEFGMEKDDYESLGYENFPRNGEMHFREEMYWLKKVEYLVPRLNDLELDTALPDSLFQVLEPKRSQETRTPRNPRQTSTSFWSAPMHWLEANVVGGFTEGERELILECRQEGFTDELTIQECLGFELFSKLRGIRGLSFNPSGTAVFTIDVSTFSPNGEITRRLVTTMNLRNIPSLVGKSDVGGVTPLVYWQKIFY